MKLLKTYIHNSVSHLTFPEEYRYEKTVNKKRGFTLIEIVVTLSITVAILGFTVVGGIGSLFTNSLDAQMYKIIGDLFTARNDALLNLHQVSHGVHFEKTSFSMFENTYEEGQSNNEISRVAPSFSLSGLNQVTFVPLTGESIASGTVSLINTNSPKNHREINIDNHGVIDWH